MIPNKKDTSKLFNIYEEQKGGHNPNKCSQKFIETECERIFEKCVSKIAEYNNKNLRLPKYLFINSYTVEKMFTYYSSHSRLIAIKRFMGAKIVICGIEDDEVIVGG